MEKDVKKKILDIVKDKDYKKGSSYSQYELSYEGYAINGEDIIFRFYVQSERYFYVRYVVAFVRNINTNEVSASCNCPQFAVYNSCKHVGACLHYHYDKIFEFDFEKAMKEKSLAVIKMFNNNIKKGVVKEELKLDIEFSFYYRDCVNVVLKIGKDKTYVVKNKMGDFLRTYISKKGTVQFGKNFLYDPNKYYFNNEDTEIIEYFYEYFSERGNPSYANANDLSFFDGRLKGLLSKLKNKKFSVAGYGTFEGIVEGNPFEPIISKKDDKYIFDMNLDKRFHYLTLDYEYVLSGGVCYKVTKKYAELLEKMVDNGLSSLIFERNDLNIFTKNIIPIVKEEVVIDSDIDDIVVVKKPSCKLYFDFYRNYIICNLKLLYGDIGLDYFDNSSNIYRDNEYEEEVITDLLNIGFIVDNKKIKLIDFDFIGEFFDYNLENLSSKYEVFTSEKMKETKVIKNSNVSSSFSIGVDNIMNFSFDLGDIHNDELDDILNSLRQKKKYYRLKNGDLINLDKDSSLKELDNLIDDLELSSTDIKNGEGVIPKYRAIYLDSLKNNKYHIIKTDNLFDNFVNNFINYKDKDVVLSKKDKKVLRDYQTVGVNWLYNIYKCDFGGILADEMGLGKSIQIIYFFKKLLEEDKDSKFLIVVPTSLVYNWENEFKKFAPDIKYEIFSNGRNLRRERLGCSDASVYITSYGLVREDLEIYNNINFTVCVIDEAQNIKNPSAGITKAVKKINAKTKIALTGTPIENSVVELWSIFDYIMPGFLSSQNAFSSKYKVKDFDDDTNSMLVKLNKLISPFILRRKKNDVLNDLPDKIENNIYIDLSNEQKKVYAMEVKKVREEMDILVSNEGFMKAKFMILKLLTRLRQVCVDPRLIYDNYDGGSAKIDNLVDVVLELISNNHKILLFSSFKSAIELVAMEFDKRDISYYVIDGSVKSKKRMELVNSFNSDNTNVFLITLKAGGTGLNLTSADTVIHLDLWWNPQVENQATDRAHRIGQKNNVSVIKLVARGTIEERILELQDKKKLLSDKLIEGEDREKNIISELSLDDLKNLLAYEQE